MLSDKISSKTCKKVLLYQDNTCVKFLGLWGKTTSEFRQNFESVTHPNNKALRKKGKSWGKPGFYLYQQASSMQLPSHRAQNSYIIISQYCLNP